MIRFFATFTFLLCCFNPRYATTAFQYSVNNSDSTILLNDLRTEVAYFRKENRIKGLAIALFTNDKVIWREGSGITTYGYKAGTKTLFSLQSISKNFTAMAVLFAVQDGLLDLDKPVTTYLPDFSVNSCFEQNPQEKITLRMLLSHTAGFTHEAPVGNNYNYIFGAFSDHLESIQNTWLKFPVGTNYSYSNLGFDLAAQIIEKVSGMSFNEYLKKKIFNPLGMISSTIDDNEFISNNDRSEGTIQGVKTKHYPIPFIGSGALYTSVDDLIRYVQFQMNFGKINDNQLISKDLLHQMYSIRMSNYGLGIYIDKNHNSYYLNHNGGGFGYGASILWFPEYKIGCVVLGNKSADYFSLASATIEDFIIRIKDYIIQNDIKNVKDTVVTDGFDPFKNPSGIKPCENPNVSAILKDSIYTDEWNKYCGTYTIVTGGMEFKWYVMIAMFFGYNPLKIKVVARDNAIYMEGRSGFSKLKQYLPGLFFTRDGEAFDFRKEPVTFRNIVLKRRK